jgi:DNA-binding transcriptional ArsR family regulator
MVYYSPAALDRTFAALADPTRRALLARLSETDNVSISELAKPFAMSLPAVMKHLDVLSDAGLVARNKTGRTVACRLRAAPMEQATDWLNRYQRFWSESAGWGPAKSNRCAPNPIRAPAAATAG